MPSSRFTANRWSYTYIVVRQCTTSGKLYTLTGSTWAVSAKAVLIDVSDRYESTAWSIVDVQIHNDRVEATGEMLETQMSHYNATMEMLNSHPSQWRHSNRDSLT